MTGSRIKPLAEQSAGWCVHYRGRHAREVCAAGVTYDSIRDDAGRLASFANLPCFAGDARLPCAHRRFPTAEEVAAEVESSDRAMANVGKARRAIVVTGLQSGAIDCPICGKAKSLRFTVSAYNGHIHAGCPGCVSWME